VFVLFVKVQFDEATNAIEFTTLTTCVEKLTVPLDMFTKSPDSMFVKNEVPVPTTFAEVVLTDTEPESAFMAIKLLLVGTKYSCFRLLSESVEEYGKYSFIDADISLTTLPVEFELVND
jgi:hypothetical protein